MQNGKTALKVSEDIELRLPEVSFANALYEVVDQNRTHLRKWLSWVDKTNGVDNIRDFLKTSRMLNKGGQRLTVFIFKKDIIIGSIGLVKIDKDNQYCEIGYWLRSDYQGQGIMSQACKRFVNYTFKTMEINRIEIKVAVSNLKSQAIPRRLGFSHEATLRQTLRLYDIYHDVNLYSQLRSEWEKGQFGARNK